MKVAALAIDSRHLASLHPEERKLVAHARDKRLAEFATGRALLRELLDSPAPIARAAHGAPDWPEGIVGSLAHDHTHAVAVIASAAEYRAIGIDVESHARSDDELRESVLRTDDPDINPTAAFVMKEAAYKAWSDLGGEPVGPLEVHLRVDGDRFVAVMPDGSTIGGMLRDDGHWWLAIAAIPTVEWRGRVDAS